MSEQALQALVYLSTNGPARLGTAEKILERMSDVGLIGIYDFTTKVYCITPYGKGVLREVQKAGTEAMMKRMGAYLE